MAKRPLPLMKQAPMMAPDLGESKAINALSAF
jgi:hypothetical protein